MDTLMGAVFRLRNIPLQVLMLWTPSFPILLRAPTAPFPYLIRIVEAAQALTQIRPRSVRPLSTRVPLCTSPLAVPTFI